MEWISLFTDWVFASPWERLLLCAETIVIMIGGPLAWWNRWTLKSNVQTLKSNVQTLKCQMRKQQGALTDMHRKQDELLNMMREMVGKPEEKQRHILEVATMRASAMGATASVSVRPDESDGR